jgi:hypothetical protein
MNRSLNIQLTPFLKSASLKRGAIFGSILIGALLSFEIFNFATTSFALQDMLGDLKFAGVRWSAMLAIAFCGMDFAGIARIFTPEEGREEPVEVWYLFGAWLLAAAFNAMLTWWGVSVAILNHNAVGGSLIGQAVMTKAVPIFVAAMVWLIRVLIIGTFSVAGERLFSMAGDGQQPASHQRSAARPVVNSPRPAPAPRPMPVPSYAASRAEPTYHPIGMTAMGRSEQNSSSVRR